MRHSILLADDSATIRKVVELTFGDTDYHVECAASGDEALDKLDLLRPDIVLADVVMPGPTGYELCRRIKASDRPVPVLLLAGTFENFDHDQARECGADGCLLKPFDSRTLLERVESLIADREAMNRSALEPVDDQVLDGALEAQVPAEPEPLLRAEAEGTSTETDEKPSAGDDELPAGLDTKALDTIARAVVERLSDDVVREIAREVVPRVAERVVRERIRELERDES